MKLFFQPCRHQCQRPLGRGRSEYCNKSIPYTNRKQEASGGVRSGFGVAWWSLSQTTVLSASSETASMTVYCAWQDEGTDPSQPRVCCSSLAAS